MIPLSSIKKNPDNPRILKDKKFEKALKSLLVFPEMMPIRPIVEGGDGMILGGNMRHSVCLHINKIGKAEVVKLLDKYRETDGQDYSDNLPALEPLFSGNYPDRWVVKASELTEQQRQAFIIRDNVGYGEWDWDVLANEWDAEKLGDWGLDLPDYSKGLDVNNMTDDDVSLDDEFDPIGSASDLHKIVFIFDNPSDGESFLKTRLPDIEYKKVCGSAGSIWQVNMAKTYGK